MSSESNTDDSIEQLDVGDPVTSPNTDIQEETVDTELDIPIRTHPTFRPTIIWLSIIFLIGVGAIAYINLRPDLFENRETAVVVARAIMLLTVIGVVRFLIRVYILRRTRYIIDEEGIMRQYDLLFRSWRRRVPIVKIRSHQLSQSRIQKLLGYGTISLNQGLGEVELEHVPNPHAVHESIGDLVEQQNHQ